MRDWHHVRVVHLLYHHLLLELVLCKHMWWELVGYYLASGQHAGLLRGKHWSPWRAYYHWLCIWVASSHGRHVVGVELRHIPRIKRLVVAVWL